MKFVKISLMAILMALVVMSCSDDSTNPDDGGDGGGDGNTIPNSMVTITTTVGGEEVDSKTLELKDGKFIPDNYSIGGSYNGTSRLLAINFTEVSTTGASYSCQLNSLMDKFEVGTYNYQKDDGMLISGAYVNKDLGEQTYLANSATLVITKVQFIGNNNAGTYYTTGTLEMNLSNENNATPNVVVKASFESVPLTTIFLNI